MDFDVVPRRFDAFELLASPLRTLMFDGLGPAKVGMTVREVESALKLKLTGDEPPSGLDPEGMSDFQACHYVSNEAKLPGVQFMVVDGKVGRIDVGRDGYRTAKGAHVGSTEAEIRRLYPAIEVEAHPYDPGGHYLRLASRDRRYGMIFETDGARVTDFRSGWLEPVGYVEGCS
jgi:hypothetical protein